MSFIDQNFINIGRSNDHFTVKVKTELLDILVKKGVDLNAFKTPSISIQLS